MAIRSSRFIDCTKHPDLLASSPVAAQIRASATAQGLLSDLDDNWTLAGKNLDGKDYVIDEASRTITINTDGLSAGAILRSRYFQNTLVLRSFAALRAAWQAERKDDVRSMHRPDLWPLIERIFAADLAAMTIRMAFELRQQKHDPLWRHAMGDEWGDIAAGYARARDNAAEDSSAMTGAFLQWFTKDSRITRSDHSALNDMDKLLAGLTMEGRGQIGEGAIRCLTLDPLTGASYLGAAAGQIAGDPAWRTISDPVAEAHFSQIMDEIGVTRVGYVTMRDKKLATRLFPETFINA